MEKARLSQLEERLRCGKANANRNNLSSKQAIRGDIWNPNTEDRREFQQPN